MSSSNALPLDDIFQVQSLAKERSLAAVALQLTIKEQPILHGEDRLLGQRSPHKQHLPRIDLR
jgi:hypothetical protein